ncbi:hypothetical protein FJT64_003096 [Amphibalanus amphitrite]|uniref:Uncharacterized protein n=1 Tax=Amphibalanus amphitrite TaxID=1232801 RepID=A0A6A4WF70_AMPAM|nr:hypothetical protein FJT64_003096 [Amphibalanus amphitrite]
MQRGACRRLLGAAARLGLLLVLAALVWQQWAQYRAQPVSSSSRRRLAPFPRLTLCPGMHLKDLAALRALRLRLENGTLTVAEFYNRTTLQLTSSEHNRLTILGRRPITERVGGRGQLGLWRQRFYFVHQDGGAWPARCYTFEPSEYLQRRSVNEVELLLFLGVAPLFTDHRGIAYRLYVHGAEEANGAASHRVAAHMRRLADVRRRPCRSEPGYSLTQCLKECQWRRLAGHIGCRLPHMVSAGVFLPDTRGPLDHLPP